MILEQAINCNNMDNACALIQGALGITDGGVAAYVMPRDEGWPKMDRDQRGRALAAWLRAELQYAADNARGGQ